MLPVPIQPVSCEIDPGERHPEAINLGQMAAIGQDSDGCQEPGTGGRESDGTPRVRLKAVLTKPT